MGFFVGALATYPARALTLWYTVLISVGTVALSLPVCLRPGVPALDLHDALFTATSAACVTGLVVRDVAEFSFAGQLVLLLLIQLGGIGIMTLATLVVIQITGHQTLRQLVLARESLGMKPHEDIGRLLTRVVVACLVFELAGALLLTLCRLGESSPPAALWWGLFHAVSAFCNAGFALAPDNMAAWQGQLPVGLTVTALVVLGGLGLPVLADLFSERRRRGALRWRDLHLHSQIVLAATLVLLLGGAVLIYLLERERALAGGGAMEAAMTALFHSASARTAGFSTLDISAFSGATLFLLMGLMFVGAGPGSAGGGIKVTTVAVLTLYGLARLRGKSETAIFRHRISKGTIAAASVVVIVGISLITTLLFLLLTAEQVSVQHGQPTFLASAFEVISAFSTVGLSTGITDTLSDNGKLLLVSTMFVGRIGPLVLVTLLIRRRHGPAVMHPVGEVHIG
jgi:trk system potassium uptake protein TrkH